MGSIRSLEQELVSPWDDGIYKPHHTYSPRFSYKIGIQVVQVFQEKHSHSAMHNIQQEVSQNDMMGMFLEILQWLLHFGEMLHSVDHFWQCLAQQEKVNQADPENMIGISAIATSVNVTMKKLQ